MKKLLIGTALCALFAVPALAGEPAKVATQPITLSSTQMDKVTAGGFCYNCANYAAVYQANVNYSYRSDVDQKNRSSIRQSIN
jgi:hypothetical protein